MSLGLAGDFHAALAKGLETAGIAGCLAVGILLVSTLFRLPAEWKRSARQELSAKPHIPRNKDCGQCPQSLFG